LPAGILRPQALGPRRVKRKISGRGGLLFKGSGFYSTDYRSGRLQTVREKGFRPRQILRQRRQAAAKPENKSAKPPPKT